MTYEYGAPMRMQYTGRNCTYVSDYDYQEWERQGRMSPDGAMAGRKDCIDLRDYDEYIPLGAQDFNGWSCSCESDYCNTGESRPISSSAGHVTISMVTSIMAAIMAAIMC